MKDNKLLKVFQLGGYTPTNLQNFNYVPTYVGKPLETQKEVGMQMMNLFNTNLAQASAVDIMNGQRQVIDGDSEVNDEISKRYNSELEAIAKSGDYENMTMRINALARKYQTDPDVKAVSESRANFDRQQKLAEEIRMKTGKDPLFMGDPAAHRTVTIDPETGKKTYNVFRSTAEADLDKQARRQSIWSVIQPNMGPLTQNQVRTMLPAIDGYIATGTWRGISGGENGKIAQLLESAMNSYRGTTEYKQEKRFLQETQPEADAEATIRQRMFDEGLLKTFSQVDPSYVRDWMLEDRMKTTATPDIPPGEELPAVPVETVLGFNLTDFANLPRNVADGAVFIAPTNHWNPWAKPGENTGSVYKGPKRDRSAQEIKNFQEAAMAATQIFGGDEAAKEAAQQGSAYYDTPQAFERVKQYQEFVELRLTFPKEQPFTPELQKTYTNELRKGITSRLLYDPATNKVYHPNLDNGEMNPEFVEQFGGKVENMEVSGFVHPKNSYAKTSGNERFSDGLMVAVNDTKNNVIKKLVATRAEGEYDTREGAYKNSLNRLWTELGLNPGKIRKFNLAGIEVEAQAIPDINDPKGERERIKIYRVGDNDYNDPVKGPVVVPTYEGLLNRIIQMAQE